MERLTYDFAIGGNHCWQVKGADNLECREVCERQGDEGCKACPIAKTFDRLAAYEDTGLEPEEILRILDAYGRGMTLRTESAQRLEIVKDIQTDRLRELAQADREGRCVVLPAKTVFELIWDAGPGCDLVCPFSIDGVGQCDYCDHGKLFVYERPCRQEHIERIGADVFMTREEAEAALRREQDG